MRPSLLGAMNSAEDELEMTMSDEHRSEPKEKDGAEEEKTAEIEGATLTQEDEEVLLKRLRELGYVE